MRLRKHLSARTPVCANRQIFSRRILQPRQMRQTRFQRPSHDRPCLRTRRTKGCDRRVILSAPIFSNVDRGKILRLEAAKPHLRLSADTSGGASGDIAWHRGTSGGIGASGHRGASGHQGALGHWGTSGHRDIGGHRGTSRGIRGHRGASGWVDSRIRKWADAFAAHVVGSGWAHHL